MTKKEFLTNCDFNNIDMESQIEKVMELVDNGIDTLPDERDKECSYKSDKDGNPQEDGKYIAQNQELKEANAQLLIDFPNLENILRGILSKELFLVEQKFASIESEYKQLVKESKDNKLSDRDTDKR